MSFSIDQFRLDGKVAIVTGAGGRGNSIGRAHSGSAKQAPKSSSPTFRPKARKMSATK